MAMQLVIGYGNEHDEMILIGDDEQIMLDYWADVGAAVGAEILAYLGQIDLTNPDYVEQLVGAFEAAIPLLANPSQDVVPGDDAMVMLKRGAQANQYLIKALDYWDDVVEIALM